MKTTTLAGVWIFTLAAVVAEVYASQSIHDINLAASAVIVFALSQAAAIITFYMDLKDEPGSVILLVLVPVMFLAGLLISVVASLG